MLKRALRCLLAALLCAALAGQLAPIVHANCVAADAGNGCSLPK